MPYMHIQKCARNPCEIREATPGINHIRLVCGCSMLHAVPDSLQASMTRHMKCTCLLPVTSLGTVPFPWGLEEDRVHPLVIHGP